jgi:hypothetical protein
VVLSDGRGEEHRHRAVDFFATEVLIGPFVVVEIFLDVRSETSQIIALSRCNVFRVDSDAAIEFLGCSASENPKNE